MIPYDSISPDSRQDEIKQDLIDWTIVEEISMLDIFDPLKQPTLLPSESDEIISKTPSVATSNIDTPVAPVTFVISIPRPYSIKLKLKLATCLELKPLSRIIQQLLNEPQVQQVKEKEFFQDFSTYVSRSFVRILKLISPITV